MKKTIKIPPDFSVPVRILREHYLLEPLSPQHNELDYDAWMSSKEQLKGIFGPKSNWPDNVVSKEQNLQDLKKHYKEFKEKIAFAYTILDVQRTECLGCLYIRPTNASGYDCRIDFWFKNSFKHFENVFYEDLKTWLKNEWHFSNIIFPGRNLSWENYYLLSGD